MGHSKNKLTIRILSIISAISILCLCIYVPETSAKADGGGFQFLYTLSQYEYLHEIDQTDPLYNPNNIRQEFCNFVRFVDWNSSIDYSSSIEDFATFLNNDTTFQSLDFEQYKVICFNSSSYTQTDVVVYTSSRPLYVTNGYIYSYELNNSNSFSFKKYTLTYTHNYMSMTNISYSSSGSTQNISSGQSVNSTYFIYSYDNQFVNSKGHIVYSDCPVRFGYDSSSPGIDNSGDDSCTANQLFTANEDGFSIYPVLAIDRRTCCPSWVDTSMSPEDRDITERSRCGADDVYFYITGKPDNLSCNYGIVPNRYTIVNRSHCYLELYYVLDIKGNYPDLAGDFEHIITTDYSDKYMAMLTSDYYGNNTYNGYEKNHKISVSLSEVQDRWEEFQTSVPSYFEDVTTDVIRVYPSGIDPPYDEKDVPLPINDYIGVLSKTFGYSYTSGTNFGGTIKLSDMFQVNGNIINSSSKSNISNFSIEVWARIVDTENSSKNTGLAKFTYNCITGDSTYYGDPIIYDDDDLVNDPDAPVPTTPPTTEVDPTQPTTQTVVVDGGKNSVIVTNTNNNTNNPTFNNSPTVNVTVSGGGSDSSTETDGLIVIKDDDSVEFEDVQDVMDGVENFLDFGDTYFDEYIGTLLSVIPSEVWRPFAISSAFIALACMIGYILKR